ncbi:MAG: sulfate transporter CysZ [Gammaproteobacteria bacterium]|nr:MAG: sulfate transporter CysZ [Gammaproteobacteria bacterium]UCH38794.1 MAG: sulfate transporter CysZ [Gammaproteobacteria bacterium]
MLADISKGTQALARSFSLLNQPGIRVYVIVPFLINLLLFGGLVWYGYNQFVPFVAWLMSYVPAFLEFVEIFFWLFFGALAALIVFFAFTPVANIIAAPFNALMSEKIETHLTGRPPSSDVGFMQMAIDAIASQLRKLVYIMLWALGLFLVSLIPVVNIIAPVLWVVFGSWLLSLEYFDYPMGNHDLVFAEQKRRLAERRGISLGFGGGIMIMTSIPIINFFAMPVGVAGATLLWVEQFQTTPPPKTDPAA